MEIKIFLFHRVSPVPDILWNPMSPALFKQIISYLHKNYEIVPLEKTLLKAYIPGGKKKLCAITFDDGYKDFIDYALPILQHFKAPCSMYLATNCIDEGLPPWTFIMNHLFIQTSHLSLDLKSKALPPHLQNTAWRDKKERIKYASRLSPFIKNLNNFERKLIFEQIKNDFNDVDQPTGMVMSWDEIREAKANGCQIGSHSLTHPLFIKNLSEKELQTELVSSGEKIKQELGEFPETISYPFGSYNEFIKKLAQQSGYKIGLAVNNQHYISEKHDLFEVPRIELYSEPFLKSKLRINGIVGKINRAVKRKDN